MASARLMNWALIFLLIGFSVLKHMQAQDKNEMIPSPTKKESDHTVHSFQLVVIN